MVKGTYHIDNYKVVYEADTAEELAKLLNMETKEQIPIHSELHINAKKFADTGCLSLGKQPFAFL